MTTFTTAAAEKAARQCVQDSTPTVRPNRLLSTILWQPCASYTERDSGAVDELQTYERKPNGTFGAKDGHHDDILMTRCIGLFIAQEMARNGGCDITALKRPFC